MWCHKWFNSVSSLQAQMEMGSIRKNRNSLIMGVSALFGVTFLYKSFLSTKYLEECSIGKHINLKIFNQFIWLIIKTKPAPPDAINSLDVRQDDPCILNVIRKQYLYPPSEKPLNLKNPDVENTSMGQAQTVLEILNNKVGINKFLANFSPTILWRRRISRSKLERNSRFNITSLLWILEKRILYRMRCARWWNTIEYALHGEKSRLGGSADRGRSCQLPHAYQETPKSLGSSSMSQ